MTKTLAERDLERIAALEAEITDLKTENELQRLMLREKAERIAALEAEVRYFKAPEVIDHERIEQLEADIERRITDENVVHERAVQLEGALRKIRRTWDGYSRSDDVSIHNVGDAILEADALLTKQEQG